MRIAAVVIVLVVFGGLLAAQLLIDNRTPSPEERASITTVCVQCHGSVPAYDAVSRVHDKHITFRCSRCHGGDGGVEAAAASLDGVGWLGAGMVFLALVGISGHLRTANGKREVS